LKNTTFLWLPERSCPLRKNKLSFKFVGD
jgi:hypothetical protein